MPWWGQVYVAVAKFFGAPKNSVGGFMKNLKELLLIASLLAIASSQVGMTSCPNSQPDGADCTDDPTVCTVAAQCDNGVCVKL